MATVTPAGDGMTAFVLTIVFLVLGWTTVTARLVVRHLTKAVGLDDWLMLLGLIMTTAWTGPLFVYCLSGGGYQADQISPEMQTRALKFYMICQSVYCPTTIPIKLSICVALLRIAKSQRRYRYIIYAIGVITIVAGLGAMISIVASCSPTSAFWNGPPEKCDSVVNAFAAYFISTCSILTDWSLAILPAVMLWNVQLKRAIKVYVAIILSMAAFASCATLVRLRFLLFLLSNKSIFLHGSAKIAYWTVLELGIGIFAGSLPALRPLLRYIPGLRTDSSDQAYPAYKLNTPGANRPVGKTINSFQQVVDEVPYHGRKSFGDADSQKHILTNAHELSYSSKFRKQTAITVTRFDEWKKPQSTRKMFDVTICGLCVQ